MFWCGCLRRHRPTLRQSVQPYPFGDGPPVEADFTHDRSAALAAGLQRFEAGGPVLVPGTAARREEKPMLHHLWLFIAPVERTRHQLRLAAVRCKWFMLTRGAAHLLL